MDKKDIKNLKKRYLVWLYKTTKEALEKIERKFTQAKIDRFILKELKRYNKDNKIEKFIREFNEYIENKEEDGLRLKFEGRSLNPDYYFLALKLKAVEKAIIKELGKAALEKIRDLYTQEMLKRIIEERINKV